MRPVTGQYLKRRAILLPVLTMTMPISLSAAAIFASMKAQAAATASPESLLDLFARPQQRLGYLRDNLTIDGKPHAPQTPADALKSGIGVIYQELHLVDELSVAENLFLGALPSKSGIVDKAKLAADTKAALARIKLDVRPETRLGDLSLAQRQMVEIAKALVRDARVVAFDEPTSSLSAREADTLFDHFIELMQARKAS